MDTDLISYESMLIARDSANWAYWSMVAAFCSAGATLLAAIIAFWTINSWKRQARAQEVRNFNLAVYNYHNSIIRAPERQEGKELEDLDYELFMQTYKTLASVYEANLMVHSALVRGKTSALFSQLSEIQTQYCNCELTRDEASKKILEIRSSSRLLKSSY
ncbi:hypothetical protein [Serratia rubidaea]|uniref:hypothetical protein n=1 Tax=Serratia rubidaea TaxID=61652 RepID=UPI0022B85AC2|nr:hypothetical protein [Serratia rubidaea]WBF47275.1 hypothetical protein OLD77_09575 [Serratia rubidaea]